MLLNSYEKTCERMSRCEKITFRRAPFHQGWATVDPEDEDPRVVYLVLAYGVVAYFDKEATPRKRLGLVPLQGASITPCPSGASILLKHPRLSLCTWWSPNPGQAFLPGIGTFDF